MSDTKQAAILIEAAEKDISALGGMFDVSIFADEIFGFHAQQAAEKLLKAWIAILGVEYPLTHNVEALLDILEQQGAAVQRFSTLEEFTPYAVRHRYASQAQSADPIDRLATVHLVDVLCLRVKDLLPADE